MTKEVLERHVAEPKAPDAVAFSMRESIANLVARYALAYDTRDWDTLIGCFTLDASFTLRVEGSDLVGPFQGPADILRLMRDSAAAQDDRRRHLCTNLMVEPSGPDRAIARSYLTLISIRDGHLEVLSTGTYTDEVVLYGGAWRLRTRHLELDLPSDGRRRG
ncbi:nuclear transport factor 2 family protein [Archangium primigenium]|uniref:nuclear transport factor 2 family protein n=1 Tax=[Archangium] primigenium TaxID=2792470 RepID=UPI00195D6FAE|nr:nuclear transport factor 2 family protein [Archangium primigenium]MBM7112804.1 nuclear transport factor 2 family protein [Archangium primigenium]